MNSYIYATTSINSNSRNNYSSILFIDDLIKRIFGDSKSKLKIHISLDLGLWSSIVLL